MIEIRTATPDDLAVSALVTAHIAHGDAHYPAGSNYHLDESALFAGDVRVVAAWDGKFCVGIGALKPFRGGLELKSMHVRSDARGRGVGAAILDHLVSLARSEGHSAVWLETGSRDASAAARRLYRSRGFATCPPFGTYPDDPESVFMRLDLS